MKMITARAGTDFTDDDACFKTFTIDVTTLKVMHYGQIEVYGCEALRDLIVDLLNCAGAVIERRAGLVDLEMHEDLYNDDEYDFV